MSMNNFGSLLLLYTAIVGVSPANGAAVGRHKDAIDPGLNTRTGRLMRKAHASNDMFVDAEQDQTAALVDPDGHISYSSEMVDSDQDDEFDTNASLFDEDDDFELPPFPDQSLLEDNATDYEDSGLRCSTIWRLSGNTNLKVTPDSRIVASSYWHNRGDHGRGQMWRTRLNNHGTTWCAHHNVKNTWVQWDFGADKIVTRSLNMGRHNCHQWVKTYKILYKSEKTGWKWYPHTLNGGNWRWCRTNNLQPVLARWIRIYVQTWHGHISMRADWDGCTPSVLGPKGATGSRGAPGARGSSGAKGATGAKGASGARGPSGSRGHNGAKGTHGAKGSTGHRGIQGVKGSKGASGAKGHTGARGATGSKGAPGVKGATGNTGKVGHIGRTGPKGDKGVKGSKGASGATGRTGARGAIGSKGVTGTKGATGNTGKAGHIGHTGPKGDKGETPAPIDCVWAEWSEYSECTKSCGLGADAGTHSRSRGFKVDPQNSGKDCKGNMFDTKQCNVKACPTTTTTTTTTTEPAAESSAKPWWKSLR